MTDPLKITSFGATEGKDCTTALNYCFEVARHQQQTVEIPPGKWIYSDILTAVGVTIYGSQGSILWALDPLRSALFLQGDGASVSYLTLSGVPPIARGTTRESCRVVAMQATNFDVHDLVIETCAGAGIRSDHSTDGAITGNTLTGTKADSIHITDQSQRLMIATNTIDQSGDDGIAVVSYWSQGAPCSDIKARSNRISNNLGGRCMSAVGGSNILYWLNELKNNPWAAAMYFAQEPSYDTFGVTGATAHRNTIVNCGNASKDHAAIMCFSYNAARPNTDVDISCNVVSQNDARAGVRIFGPVTNWRVAENMIQAAPALQVPTTGGVVVPFSGGPVGVSE